MKGSILILLCAVIYFVDACKKGTTKKPGISYEHAVDSAKGDRAIQVLKDYMDENKPFSTTKIHQGRNLLIIAASYGNTEAVSLLLAAGVAVNAQDKDGYTALHRAAFYGKTDTVKMLLENVKTDVNIQTKNGDTALILAVYDYRHTDIVKMLLENVNTDVNIRDYDSYTALIHAAKDGYTDIVKILLENVNIDVNMQTYGAKVGQTGNTALIYATFDDDTDMVKMLLENENIDVNIQNKFGWTALSVAASNGFTDIVKMLLENEDIDVNIRGQLGNSALGVAKNKEIIKMLEKAGAECWCESFACRRKGNCHYD